MNEQFKRFWSGGGVVLGHVVNAHAQSYTAANLPKTATACSCPEMSCTNARTLYQIGGGGGGVLQTHTNIARLRLIYQSQ